MHVSTYNSVVYKECICTQTHLYTHKHTRVHTHSCTHARTLADIRP